MKTQKINGSFNNVNVFVNIIKEGTGNIINKDTFVSIRYIGKLLNGKVFDANTGDKKLSQKPALEINAGNGNLIPGFDLSLLGLKKGSIVRFIIPSSLAYGDKGAGDVIPANSILDFYLELKIN